MAGQIKGSSPNNFSGIWSARDQQVFQTQGTWPVLVPVVSDSLVLLLDAANSESYSGTGTTWSDISGTGNHGTLQSGVSYVPNGALSYFLFDDTSNGYVSLPLLSTSITNITMLALVNMPASDGGAIFYNGSSAGYGFGIGASSFDNAGNNAIGLFQVRRWIDTNVDWGTGWMLVGMSLNATSGVSFIKNNSIIATNTGTAPLTPVSYAALGTDTGGTRAFNGNIAWAGFYSKELSQQEIEQNYNHLAPRFA